MRSPYKTSSREYRIFEAALDIHEPWEIKEVRLDYGRRRLDIILDFQLGAEFSCSQCKKNLTAYDTRIREWRHLDFFQFETHIFAPLPRTKGSSQNNFRITVNKTNIYQWLGIKNTEVIEVRALNALIAESRQ